MYHPKTRKIAVFQPARVQMLIVEDTLSEETVLPSFSSLLAEIF